MDDTNLAIASDEEYPFTRVGVIDLADMLLAGLVSHRTSAVFIEPHGYEHTIRADGHGVLGRVDSAHADAVVARLALVFGLDVAALDGQHARMRVGLGKRTMSVELLLRTRVTDGGLIAEIQRIPNVDDLVVAGRNQPPPLTGMLGNYKLGEELGRGGMGVVYRAHHVILQKDVALKMLLPRYAQNAAYAAQFVLEAQAACRARHPGIVDVTDFGIAPGGRAYFVMELVGAPTLAQLLARGALEAARAVVIARGIAAALGAAAAHGVVHRDLKPSNVFVLAGDQTKLGDFGVAAIRGPEGRQTDPFGESAVGTPHYMSPEQGLGEPTDVRSDLYSLGCVLFEMLTGVPPFSSPTAIATIEQHATEPVPPMIGPDGPVPNGMQRVVLRAMAKRPEERYQSAAEMLADLDRAARTLARGDWRRWLPW